MLYFKNSELTKTYKVALNTVLNWIKAAQNGKLDIELVKKGERFFIANTARNINALNDLAISRKKYRNSRTARRVVPHDHFYEVYSESEILDIVATLDVRREVPRAYNYFDDGAHYWDKYAHELEAQDTPNIMNRTRSLLDANQGYIDTLIKPFHRVNVIDIGVGNALPVRSFLGNLLSSGKLGRYLALDISPGMLEIAEQNIKSWFDDKINFEGHKIDITHERFGNFLANEYLNNQSESTINLILFLGGTLGNLRAPADTLAVIANSMGRADMLLMSQKLDSTRTRHYFDFNTSPNNPSLAPIHRFVFDMLNIDESLYRVEMGFHPEHHARYIRVHLIVSLQIEFRLADGIRLISLEKGDSILLWYFWQQTLPEVSDQLIKGGFYPIHLSQSPDKEYLLSIARLDSSLTF